jgi:hypothetical protein
LHVGHSWLIGDESPDPRSGSADASGDEPSECSGHNEVVIGCPSR